MKKQPKNMTACTVDCVLMPQGEVLTAGQTVGWFKDLKKYLKTQSDRSDLLDAAKQAVCGNMGWKGKLNYAIKNIEAE